MSESETPRVDEYCKDIESAVGLGPRAKYDCMVQLARTLQRENAHMRSNLVRWGERAQEHHIKLWALANKLGFDGDHHDEFYIIEILTSERDHARAELSSALARVKALEAAYEHLRASTLDPPKPGTPAHFLAGTTNAPRSITEATIEQDQPQ